MNSVDILSHNKGMVYINSPYSNICLGSLYSNNHFFLYFLLTIMKLTSDMFRIRLEFQKGND